MAFSTFGYESIHNCHASEHTWNKSQPAGSLRPYFPKMTNPTSSFLTLSASALLVPYRYLHLDTPIRVDGSCMQGTVAAPFPTPFCETITTQPIRTLRFSKHTTTATSLGPLSRLRLSGYAIRCSVFFSDPATFQIPNSLTTLANR